MTLSIMSIVRMVSILHTYSVSQNAFDDIGIKSTLNKQNIYERKNSKEKKNLRVFWKSPISNCTYFADKNLSLTSSIWIIDKWQEHD